MFSRVQPKEYQVDAAHKVATERYSGYRLVWPKLDPNLNLVCHRCAYFTFPGLIPGLKSKKLSPALGLFCSAKLKFEAQV